QFGRIRNLNACKRAPNGARDMSYRTLKDDNLQEQMRHLWSFVGNLCIPNPLQLCPSSSKCANLDGSSEKQKTSKTKRKRKIRARHTRGIGCTFCLSCS